MQTIAIITWIASATGVFALIGFLGREVERADEAIRLSAIRMRLHLADRYSRSGYN